MNYHKFLHLFDCRFRRDAGVTRRISWVVFQASVRIYIYTLTHTHTHNLHTHACARSYSSTHMRFLLLFFLLFLLFFLSFLSLLLLLLRLLLKVSRFYWAFCPWRLESEVTFAHDIPFFFLFFFFFWSLWYSAILRSLEQTHCASMWFHMSE